MDSDVEELLNELRSQCSGKNYLFRGEAKDYGAENNCPKPKKVNSLLFRKRISVWSEKFHPIHAEKQIVDEAKKNLDLSPNTSNIEILINLRHYGGEVNLIDFSRNLYVALFFACNEHSKDPGKLILLNTDKLEEKEVSEIDYNKLTPDSNLFMIKPTRTEISRDRVLSQKSTFCLCS